MLNLDLELTFDFDFVCNNFKLPHQILSCYQPIWPYMLLCFFIFFFLARRNPRKMVFCGVSKPWRQMGTNFIWRCTLEKQKARATCDGDTLENGTDGAIWIFHFLMMFNLNPPRFWIHVAQMFRLTRNDRNWDQRLPPRALCLLYFSLKPTTISHAKSIVRCIDFLC